MNKESLKLLKSLQAELEETCKKLTKRYQEFYKSTKIKKYSIFKDAGFSEVVEVGVDYVEIELKEYYREDEYHYWTFTEELFMTDEELDNYFQLLIKQHGLKND